MTDGSDWLRLLAEELGIEGFDPDGVGADDLLQFTAEVAHGVARPAAPLSTFLVGMAAGHDGGTTVNIADALTRARTLLAAQDPETS